MYSNTPLYLHHHKKSIRQYKEDIRFQFNTDKLFSLLNYVPDKSQRCELYDQMEYIIDHCHKKNNCKSMIRNLLLDYVDDEIRFIRALDLI